jgi:hypothetical protein
MHAQKQPKSQEISLSYSRARHFDIIKISEFQALLKPVTDLVSEMTVDTKLAAKLNRCFPPGAEAFDKIEKARQEAIPKGLMGASKRRCGAELGSC